MGSWYFNIKLWKVSELIERAVKMLKVIMNFHDHLTVPIALSRTVLHTHSFIIKILMEGLLTHTISIQRDAFDVF